MINLEKNELLSIEGGVSISATFLSSLARGINTIVDLGRSLGTAIRRIGSNNMCSF